MRATAAPRRRHPEVQQWVSLITSFPNAFVLALLGYFRVYSSRRLRDQIVLANRDDPPPLNCLVSSRPASVAQVSLLTNAAGGSDIEVTE